MGNSFCFLNFHSYIHLILFLNVLIIGELFFFSNSLPLSFPSITFLLISLFIYLIMLLFRFSISLCLLFI